MKTVKLGNRIVDNKNPCVVMVDAGVNHNNIPERAFELIRTAARAGADIIKFQTYKAETITTKTAPRYWNSKLDTDSGGTQYDTFKRLDKLPLETYPELIRVCKKEGIVFSSTPFDLESAKFLDDIGMEFFKISSSDITYLQLIKTAAETGKPIILSTGTASIAEIKEAVETIKKANNDDIILQHCILSYPCDAQDVNLKKMTRIMELFPDFPIGYSDHTEGIVVPLAAVALGAKTIEKHYTIDKKLPDSPDHSFSLDTSELMELVQGIKKIESSRGEFKDGHYSAEEQAYLYARKSVVAKVEIPKGIPIKREMLTCKRPGTGIYPKHLDSLVGKKAKVNIQKDTTIIWELIDKK